MAIAKTLILCAAGAGALLAQQGSVGGPISGYVYDARGHALRTIRGIPGAAVVGDPVNFGDAVNAAWVSPKLDSALIVAANGTPHFYRLDGGQASVLQAEGMVAPERVVFSPSGSALALVTPGSVRIYKGLPGAPAVSGTIALPPDSNPAGGMAYGKRLRPGGGPVAVSDDGMYLLYGTGSSVELLGVAGDSRKLADAASGAMLVFAPGGHDAAVIDAQGIALFQDASGAATVRRLPGIGGLRGADFSPDGKHLYLAGAAVAAVDVASGDRADVACDCRPSGLTRMGTAYRLNEFGSGPLWLLDTAADPRVVFVPAAQ